MQQMRNIFGAVMATIALVLAAGCCFAQSVPDVTAKFDAYSHNTLPEKLFVHTDRQTYLTGELLWFKIYAVDGIYNKPLALSKVAYVDVLDDKNIAVMQAKVNLVNGSGNGSVFIPVTVSNGHYKLRAYTSWMKNFGPAYYFEKAITIVNPQKIPEASGAKTSAGYDVQFFAEGGSLVAGLQNKVAVKVVGADGLGSDFVGAVINQKNDTLAAFVSLKFGMGSFLLTPMAGNIYRAFIRFADGKSLIKDLPAVAPQGYAMRLTDNGTGQLDIAISSQSNPNDNVFVFAHTRQLTKLAKAVTLTNGTAHVLIDKTVLDDGISQITMFNGARQPVAERLYFKRPAQKMFITARADEPQYGNRKKVTISVDTKNKTGVTLNADLSMSVCRVDGLQEAGQEDILSYLWLKSDLQGNIEQPGYYFTDGSAEAADNLMLTQGWRRFEWSNVLNSKPAAFNFLPETYGHIVTAKITNTLTNTPANGIVAYLGVPGKRVQLFTSKSDSAGRLLFNTKDLYAGEIVVQTNTLIDSTYRIDVQSPFSEQYSAGVSPQFSVNQGLKDAFEYRNIEMQVPNLFAGDRIKQFDEPQTDSSGFYKKPNNTYLLDNYVRFTTMEEVLREYVKEVVLVKRRGKFHIRIQGEKSFLEDPLILIDGLPVFDADKLMGIDPLLIRKLEVVPQRYFYGPANMESILSFTSYKGNLAGLEIDPHAIAVDYEGLQMQREFYSPVYDTEAKIKSHLPDFRNLLFWQPAVLSNGQVSFYTSDEAGEYVGLVQGIGANGEAGSAGFRFVVKP